VKSRTEKNEMEAIEGSRSGESLKETK
jgi:hypothetical protein